MLSHRALWPKRPISLSFLLALALTGTARAGGAGTAHWRFEEGSGSQAADIAGGLDGVLVGPAQWQGATPVNPVPQSGFANGASLDLNWQSTSSGGFVLVDDPSGALSPGAGSFTLEAWVQLDALSGSGGPDQRQYLFQRKPLASSNNLMEYSLLVQAGNYGSSGRELTFGYGDGGSFTTVTSSLQIQDLDWHFVSLAYDAVAGQVRFGLDGLFQVVSVSKPVLPAAGPLTIGAHENSVGAMNQFLRGKVDEARYSSAFLGPAQLLDAQAIDCDGSGVSDFAECIAGLVEDCNGNGVPDSCDIASGGSGDCQLDGIPDECQIVDFTYAYHGLDFDAQIKSDGVYTGWLDSHEVSGGRDTITHVDARLGSGFGAIGGNLTVYVWSDPDGDRDPADAQVLSSVSVSVTAEMTSQVERFDVPDVFLGPDGTRFFIGILMDTPGVSAAYHDILDFYTPGVSWIIGRDTPIDPDDLSAQAVEYAPIEDRVPFTGHWILSGVVEISERDCNQNGVPDSCDLSSGFSSDLDQNGVPDECDAGSVLLVPDTYPTIQAALDVAADETFIVVRPGVYQENLDFRGKRLTLRSQDGPAATTIDGGGLGSVVTFQSGETLESVLEGFTITGGTGTGAGIYCEDASPTIRGNVITGNSTSSIGGGVAFQGACNGHLIDNEISGNAAAAGAGVLLNLANSAPVLQGNLISNNVANGDHAGGIYSVNGSPSIVDNRIIGNSTTDSGGGLHMIFSGGGPPVISRNLFAGNFAGDDGGGIWVAISNPQISDNIFVDNVSPYGGALYLRNQQRPVQRNTFLGNTATIAGGAVYLDGGNSTTFSSSILRGSSAPTDPVLALNGEPVAIEYSNVQGGWPGVGNIDLDPLFRDVDGADDDLGTYLDNDYRLLATSPCVDSGDPGDLACPGLDAGGSPRLLDGQLAGSWRVDMGAHEFGNLAIRRVRPPVSAGGRRALPGLPLGWSWAFVRAQGTPGLQVTYSLGTSVVEGCIQDIGATYFDSGATIVLGGTAPSLTYLALPPGTQVIQATASGAGVGNTSNPIFLDVD